MPKIRRTHPFPKSIYKLFRDNYTNRSREFLRTYTHVSNLYGEYYFEMLSKAASGKSEPSQLAERYRKSLQVLLKETKQDPLTYNVIRKNSKQWLRVLSRVDGDLNNFISTLNVDQDTNLERVYKGTVKNLSSTFSGIRSRYVSFLEDFYMPMLSLILEKAGVTFTVTKKKSEDGSGTGLPALQKSRLGLPFFRIKKPTRRQEVLQSASETTRNLILKSREALQVIESQLEIRLKEEGFKFQKIYKFGQPFFEAEDPVTKEITYYDPTNGNAIGGTFKDIADSDLKDYLRGKEAITEIPTNIWPDGYIGGLPRLSETALSKAYGDVIYRSISDDATKKSLTRILPTKSINVRGLDRIVITSGRFKGYFIDDLVNKAGRMIEGTSHYIDDNGNRVNIENVDAQGRFILGKSYQDTGLEENYLTLGRDGDLVLGMPKLRKTSKTTLNKALLAVGVDPKKFQPVDKINKDGEYYRPVPRQKRDESDEAYQERKANLPEALSLQQIMGYVRDLESKDSLSKEEQDALLAFTDYLDFTAESLKRRNVQKLLKTLYPVKPNGQMYPPKKKWDANRKKFVSVKGTSSTALWKIKPEDFEAVQTILGGIAMSKGASDQVFEHYENQLKKDYALKADNVENYSTAEIGGFISDFAGKPFNFNNKQQEGIAWLAVSGYKGVMALDTGVGKTMVAIGSAQNMLKEDYAQGTNGRFLYVCPEALVGNITQDIAKFMTEDAGQDLNSRFDQHSYKEFAKFRGEDPSWGQDYIAIYFDEAHYLKGSGKLPVAAATLKHPRKIMLTASAIDKDPNDLFQITAITNNIDPKSPEFRAKKRAFSRRFAQEVGGRFVGIKNDPDVKRQFHQWVKSNAFFAPKTQVDYTQVGLPPLPELSRSSETVAMDPKVAEEYEMLAATVQKELRAAISRYRDNDIGGTEMQKIKDFAKNKNLRGALKRLSLLSIEPDKVIKGAKNPKLERAVSLGKQKIAEGKRVLYWTDNNKVAKKNAENLSKRGASSYIHVLGLKTSIQFWQDGKKIKSITSRTKVDAPLGLWAGAEGINKQLKSFEGRLEYSEDNTLLENDSNRKLIKGVNKLRDELERVKSLEKRLKRRRKAQQRLKTASGNEWAVVALKKFVKNNPLVASVTLTSNYTTGVNLQGFKTVIHLDRNAFSSESMKQRTARTWRAGAKDPVEEITLDAVVPQEQQAAEGGIGMSFDQIREMIQQADEKFIDEIISTTQDTEFSEAYKSMEQENTKSLATSRRLVEMMLDPTPQNVGVTTREITNAEKDPIKYITPRPDRFDNVQIDVDSPKAVRAAITQSFGSEVSIEDIIDASGFSTVKEIDTIKVGTGSGGSISVSVSGFGGKLQMKRVIRKDSIYNDLFKVDECLPKGIAVRALALQVSSAKKLGIGSIKCKAAGSRVSEWVGYKVWPKFGYDNKLSTLAPLARGAFEQMPELMDRLMKARGYTSRDSVTIRDLYLYPRSRDWWEENGYGFDATLRLEGEGFDTLQKYISRKVRRSGENLESYINNAPPPPSFDETNPDCFPNQGRTASSLNRLVDRYVNKKAQLEEDEGRGNEAPRLDNEDEEIFAEIFDLLAKGLDTAQEKKDLDQKLQEVG